MPASIEECKHAALSEAAIVVCVNPDLSQVLHCVHIKSK